MRLETPTKPTLFAATLVIAALLSFGLSHAQPSPREIGKDPFVYYKGLLHTALGQAQLGLAGDELIVSNIGSSGDDGVSIDIGDADGMTYTWQLPMDDTDLKFEVLGSSGVANSPPVIVREVTATDDGNKVLIDTTTYIGSIIADVLWLDDQENIVHAAFGYSGTSLGDASNLPVGFSTNTQAAPSAPTGLPFSHTSTLTEMTLAFPAGTSMTPPNAQSVTATAMKMIYDQIKDYPKFRGGNFFQSYSQGGPAEVVITDNLVAQFAAKFKASTPMTDLRGRYDEFEGSKLDASGLSTAGTSGFDMIIERLADVRLRTIYDFIYDGFFEPEVDFDLNGFVFTKAQPASLGGVSLVADSGNILVTSDFSPLGVSNVGVLFLLQGQFVGVGPSGTFDILGPDFPDGMGAFFLPGANAAIEFELTWDTPVDVSISGKQVLQIDEILIFPNENFSVGGFETLTLSTTNAPVFSIADVNVGVAGGPSDSYSFITSFGDAFLSIGNGDIGVVNEGTGGVVVSTLLNGEPLFGTQLTSVGCASDFADGAFFATRAAVVSSSGPPQAVGPLALTVTSGVLEGSGDFSALGATTARVIVRDGGNIVHDSSGNDPSLLFKVPCFPYQAVAEATGNASSPVSYSIRFEADVDVEAGFGKQPLMVLGDFIEILPENVAPFPVLGNVLTLQLDLGDIPFVLLTDVVNSEATPAPPLSARLPKSALHPAFPNPFNPRTTIAFESAQGGPVALKVYSLAGRLVSTLYEGWMPQGTQTVTWNGVDTDGHSVASGTYVVQLEAADGISTTKVTLLK